MSPQKQATFTSRRKKRFLKKRLERRKRERARRLVRRPRARRIRWKSSLMSM